VRTERTFQYVSRANQRALLNKFSLFRGEIGRRLKHILKHVLKASIVAVGPHHVAIKSSLPVVEKQNYVVKRSFSTG